MHMSMRCSGTCNRDKHARPERKTVSARCLLRLVLFAAVGAVTCLSQSGCTTQVWAPDAVAVSNKANRTVEIRAHFKPSADSDIFNGRNYAINQALATTIEKFGVFSQVVRSGNADYQLDVMETYMSEPPVFGGTVTLEIEWRWRLKQIRSNRVVWEETIKSKGVGNFSGLGGLGIIGDVRLGEAKKMAVHENIRIGLEHVSKLRDL